MKKTLLLCVAFVSAMSFTMAQTNWSEVFVRDFSNNPIPGVTVFFYGDSYNRMMAGPEKSINRTYASGNGWALVNHNGTYQAGDTLFFGAVDCNGDHVWGASIFDPNDTISVTLALPCAPSACDYVIFDSIMPTATGVDFYLEAWSLMDSAFAPPMGSPNFAWLLWPDSVWAYGTTAYFTNVDTTKTNWVEFSSFSQCAWVADTINIGSGTPPPPPVPDPNIVCNAGWYLDTVNSIVFNGNLIVWDASTATDTNGTPVNITSYFWDFGDGNFSNQQYPTHTYSDTGWQTLCLTITAVNGVDTCSSTFCDSLGIDGNGNILYKGGSASGFTLQVIDPATVSLKETESMELVLYPNPATNEVNLSWASSAHEVKLYNLSGALLQTKNVEGLNKITLNTSEIPSGVYLISISGDNSKEQLRFIKQ